MRNFTFSLKWHTILTNYPAELRREVFDAVIEYAATGNAIDMQPLARIAFDFIRYEIDEKARRREARITKKNASDSTVKPKKEKKPLKKKADLPVEHLVPEGAEHPVNKPVAAEENTTDNNEEIIVEQVPCEVVEPAPQIAAAAPVAHMEEKIKTRKVKMTVAQAIAAAGGKPRQIKVNGIRIKCPVARRNLRRA
ncbi:MAG: hypothetical protein K2M11_09535 [Paramuribaculum sp.]|nr:hypothetical protein [Paramuribaculum sp.]